tara:strand:- start:164 stop:391 length:228 start_codon:yes stop_codon:yes gene_type:complete
MSSDNSLLIENSLKYYKDEYVIGKSLFQKENEIDVSSLDKNHLTILGFLRESTGESTEESTKELTMSNYSLCETV